MSVYLHDIPLGDALKAFENALISADMFRVLGKENIPLDINALGRVLAEPVWAVQSSPTYHSSAMDGFAVRSTETNGAMLTNPLLLEVGRSAAYVNTGNPLPESFNAVIPIENVEGLNEDKSISANPRASHWIRIRASVVPWAHVRPMGEDIVATELVLPSGHSIRPVDLGAIAASGHSQITVSKKPQIGILPTGSELVEIGTTPSPGQIIEFNSLVLAGQIDDWGAIAVRLPIIEDSKEKILRIVKEQADNFDMILMIAGSSAGSKDFTAGIVESLGDLLVHGVAVRPGHPVILGMLKTSIGKELPVVGIPGYPVSAALTNEIFVEPIIAKWLGRSSNIPEETEAEITKKIVSSTGDDDFVRVIVGKVGDKMLAAPLSRGAGVITSLMRADGIALLPRGVQGVAASEKVHVKLYKRKSELRNTIFAVGSHDVCLDILSQFLAPNGYRLVSSNVGSLAGLIALKQEVAHFAGSHLLDPKTGEYNISYVRTYIPDRQIHVLGFLQRKQGLIVKPGNPHNVKGLKDLIDPHIEFINRQRGSGTRVLLDYELEKLGISSGDIRGYEREEYTHLNVAAAVASGQADCGLGIAAAAHALDMKFIPLFDERYDIIVPSEFYQGELFAQVIQVFHQKEFKQAILNIPGYGTNLLGETIAILE